MNEVVTVTVLSATILSYRMFSQWRRVSNANSGLSFFYMCVLSSAEHSNKALPEISHSLAEGIASMDLEAISRCRCASFKIL